MSGLDATVTALCTLGGLVIGDALEIVVERTGAHAAFDRPWWRCPVCAGPVTGVARVPLVRVGALRHPCGACGARRDAPWRPLALSVACALVLGTLAAHLGADPVLAPAAAFATSAVAVSAVDLERTIIPNRIVYPTLAVLVPLLVMASAVDGRWGSLWRSAVAGASGFLAFAVVHVVYPRGLGFGDVRFAGVCGLATGWFGLGHAYVGFAAAFVLAAVVGVVAMRVSGQGRKTRLPFGPFLAAGSWFAIVWGDPVVRVLLHRGG